MRRSCRETLDEIRFTLHERQAAEQYAGCAKKPSNKAAANEEMRRTLCGTLRL